MYNKTSSIEQKVNEHTKHMAPVITYLLNNAPWIAVIVLAIIGSWKLSKYHAKLEETRNKVDSLPCDKHKDGIRDSEQRYNELQRIVTSTNDMVVEINKWLMKFDNDMIDKLAKKASPLKMTPLGEVLFEKSSAKKTIDNNIDFLIKELEDINPQTAYDVEEEALSYLLRNMGNEMFADIKKFLYYSPDTIQLKDPSSGEDKDVRLSMQSIIKLMSIYLRDLHLKKHSNIV